MTIPAATQTLKAKPTTTTSTSLNKSADAESKGKETESQREARIAAKYKERATTPLKAIRSMCVNCVGLQIKQVAACKSVSCPLHPFRMGENTLHPQHGKPHEYQLKKK